MVKPSIKEELIQCLDSLDEDEQRTLLTQIRSKNILKKGVSGKELLKFAGRISKEDLELMEKAIKDGCENIDSDEW